MLSFLLASIPAFAQGFGAFVSPGPLAEDHAHLESLTQCLECHEPGAGVTADRCTACHERVGEQLKTGKGFHADKSACGTCHPDHRGRDAALTRIEGLEDFDHSVTGFPLDGAHVDADCEACHTEEGEWTGLEPTCHTCHRDEEPHGADEGRTELLLACETCHDTDAWTPPAFALGRFDHTDPQQVDFVLEGAHEPVDCVDCHIDARFVPTAHDRCTDCHDSRHRATAFDARCETCHEVVEAWRVPGFDHAKTGYLLEGQHAGVSCSRCHGSTRTAPLPHETCEDCHRDVHGGQFAPRACSDCHTVENEAFRIPDFDHDATDFPLRGAHPEATCADCHGELPESTFADLPHADCDDCHTDPHEAKFEPTACAICHDDATGDWRVSDFDHDRTDFPLKGEHQGVACASCHPDERWQVPFDDCGTCHDEHPHGSLVEPRCDTCHAETGWVPPTFDHGTTDFDLAPQHLEAACTGCHDLEGFSGAPRVCAECHDRPAGHYAGDCGECHQGAGWTPAGLGGQDHAITGFPLEASHAQLACVACHPDGSRRQDADPFCISCHVDDDIHRGMLSTACQDCHQPTAWMRTRFRHQWTGWPLRGAHRLAACQDCHAVGYIGTPTECRVCHEAEAPLDVPSHQSSFFPMCDSCHRPFTWDLVRAVH